VREIQQKLALDHAAASLPTKPSTS
jgi:hypothetical protein